MSEFLILSIGQNRKLGNFRFFSKSYLNFLLFVSAHFLSVFKSCVTTNIKIRRKQNFRDFQVFNLGYSAKSKTRKSRKFLLFLLGHITTSLFFAQFIYLPLLNLPLWLLSEFKRRDIFPRFLSFLFWA